jgi:hypothetical protein
MNHLKRISISWEENWILLWDTSKKFLLLCWTAWNTSKILICSFRYVTELQLQLMQFQMSGKSLDHCFLFLGWGETDSTWHVDHSLAYCTSAIWWMMMHVAQSVEWLAGETEAFGEKLLQCRFVHHRAHDQIWAQTHATTVASQQPTAWAIAWLLMTVLTIWEGLTYNIRLMTFIFRVGIPTLDRPEYWFCKGLRQWAIRYANTVFLLSGDTFEPHVSGTGCFCTQV